MWHFFLLYGENMKRDICDLPALTGLQLRQQIGKTRPSSPGMDSISPYELQLIARWCPDLFDHLALLLNLIENSGKWPEQIPKEPCALSLIPMMTVRLLQITDLSQFCRPSIAFVQPRVMTSSAPFGCQNGSRKILTV
jgi:hypothetical protein